jgi:adenine-specific DNA-methyltransferase
MARALGKPGRSHPRLPLTAISVRASFYERVPHITLKSIANNAEIDVIWEKRCASS